MSLKSIEQEWLNFSRMIFAKMEPSPVQVKETKQAFFAGAWAMLCAAKQIGEPQISEEEGIRFLEERQEEGRAFYRELIGRYASSN